MKFWQDVFSICSQDLYPETGIRCSDSGRITQPVTGQLQRLSRSVLKARGQQRGSNLRQMADLGYSTIMLFGSHVIDGGAKQPCDIRSNVDDVWGCFRSRAQHPWCSGK